MKTLADLIAQIESTNNPFALRYEPEHKPSMRFVDRMIKTCACSEATAMMLCMTSFGLYQIMGDELMSLGLSISPMQYLSEPDLQLTMFTDFVDQNKIDFPLISLKDEATRMHFARVYNGPRNPQAYADKMMAWLIRWGV